MFTRSGNGCRVWPMRPREDRHVEPERRESLSYEPRRATKQGRRWWEPTALARHAAGVCCGLFAGLAVYIGLVTDRGRFSMWTALQPSVLLSAAGSVFCLLVALGVLGTHGNGKS